MPQPRDDRPADTGPMAHDPVCGMKVEKALAPGTALYAGQRFFFCSDSCRATFEGDPEHYLRPRDPSSPAHP